MAATMDERQLVRAAVSMALRNSPKVSRTSRPDLQVAAELATGLIATPPVGPSRTDHRRVFSDLHTPPRRDARRACRSTARRPQQLLLASGFHDAERERAAIGFCYTASTG